MKKLYILLFCILPLVSCSQSNSKKETAGTEKAAPSKPEDVFTTLKFEMDSKPAVAVINKQYKNYKNKATFPLSLFLTVNTTDKDQNGHPTEKEAVIFHELQSRIIRELSNAFVYCHVGTTTMNGYRDILLYINPENQDKATAILNKIKEENERFSSYTFEPDPEWEAVAPFYEAVPN
ncbi:DUF695 domain-containing protein [Daejeonella lutea]|nr:DUF695 domain-containing protein [Daejeonella lutea]